jgi:hypothetical protein
MASTDAKPVPQKNVAYRVTFPILDADGDLVTGAAGLDSEVSKDGGTFADCTNEATEIATASGVYFLDLTSTEMNADTVAVIIKTSTVGAKTTTIVMYPEEAGDIRVNVTQVNGTTQTAGDIIGDTNDIQTRLPAALVSGRIDASVGAMAAGTVTAAAVATDAIDSDAIAASAVTEIQAGLATSAALALVQADTDDIQTRLPAALVAGRIDASIGAMAADTLTAAAIAADAIGASELAADAVAEIAAAIVAALTIPTAIENADALLDRVDGIESGLTPRQMLRVAIAALAGVSMITAGDRVYRSTDNAKSRITATVLNGDRTSVVLDKS